MLVQLYYYNNIGTRKIALLFLLVILIDLTRHLQLYNVKNIVYKMCGPYIYRNVLSDAQKKWDEKNIRRTALSVLVRILCNII